ncbi:hypothetical protein HBZC1_00810 [Helicobacter bizzozeronii CIII-1]|uniref:Uncharacterized protein n=1 Tax=Helicobacter bizzozeronii (strain CIII-1) TaxID=1002804 RepID=F8KQR3_HELBC|nr:hypothetical protein HBZC1_00810 [Helicobacter bizzozeronii CIII-1]CCF81859.1 hypothetical protein HBZS_123100 [Helicobacter bizzozeronii CCUG 35545]
MDQAHISVLFRVLLGITPFLTLFYGLEWGQISLFLGMRF